MSQDFLRTPRQQRRFDNDFHNRVRKHIKKTFYDCAVRKIHNYMVGHEGGYNESFTVHVEFKYKWWTSDDYSEFKEYDEHRKYVVSSFLNKFGWELEYESIETISNEVNWNISFKEKPKVPFKEKSKNVLKMFLEWLHL